MNRPHRFGPRARKRRPRLRRRNRKRRISPRRTTASGAARTVNAAGPRRSLRGPAALLTVCRAEGEGVEPSRPLPARPLSRRLPSPFGLPFRDTPQHPLLAQRAGGNCSVVKRAKFEVWFAPRCSFFSQLATRRLRTATRFLPRQPGVSGQKHPVSSAETRLGTRQLGLTLHLSCRFNAA